MNDKSHEVRKETMGGDACRMSAKSVILDKANRLHRDAAALEAIAESIPWGMIKPSVEELLWQYFVSH